MPSAGTAPSATTTMEKSLHAADDRMALIALHEGEMIAVGRYDREAGHSDRAEVAFAVEDAQQIVEPALLGIARPAPLALGRPGGERIAAEIERSSGSTILRWFANERLISAPISSKTRLSLGRVWYAVG